jgi:hypothetical protein
LALSRLSLRVIQTCAFAEAPPHHFCQSLKNPAPLSAVSHPKKIKQLAIMVKTLRMLQINFFTENVHLVPLPTGVGSADQNPKAGVWRRVENDTGGNACLRF